MVASLLSPVERSSHPESGLSRNGQRFFRKPLRTSRWLYVSGRKLCYHQAFSKRPSCTTSSLPRPFYWQHHSGCACSRSTNFGQPNADCVATLVRSAASPSLRTVPKTGSRPPSRRAAADQGAGGISRPSYADLARTKVITVFGVNSWTLYL